MQLAGWLLVALAAGACGRGGRPDERAPIAPTSEAGPTGRPTDAGLVDAPAPFHTKHMVFDDDDGGSMPAEHTEPRWGDYLDEHGKPAVGWHVHDPATGKAHESPTPMPAPPKVP
jgi:hypothetical protein